MFMGKQRFAPGNVPVRIGWADSLIRTATVRAPDQAEFSNDGKPYSSHPLRKSPGINREPTASESAMTSALSCRASRLAAALTQRAISWLYRIPGLTRRVASCPVCGGKPDRVEFNARFSPLDHCGECGHVYSRKIPLGLILHLMYGDLDYWRRDKEHQGITRIEYGPQWQGFLDARIGALEKAWALRTAPGRYFEIGCSEGILLRELGNRGHEALGCECNRPTAEAGMEALEVDIRIGLFEDTPLPGRTTTWSLRSIPSSTYPIWDRFSGKSRTSSNRTELCSSKSRPDQRNTPTPITSTSSRSSR